MSNVLVHQQEEIGPRRVQPSASLLATRPAPPYSAFLRFGKKLRHLDVKGVCVADKRLNCEINFAGFNALKIANADTCFLGKRGLCDFSAPSNLANAPPYCFDYEIWALIAHGTTMKCFLWY